MRKRSLLSTLLLIAVFALSACDSITLLLEEKDKTSPCALGGTAAKGVINAATVTVYTVDANGADGDTIGTTTAAEDGTWKLSPERCADDGLYRVSASGGTYTSEATQDTITNTVAYTALVDLNSANISASAESLAITPVTTLIDSRAVSIASSKSLLAKRSFAPTLLSDSIAAASAAVQKHYGLTTDPLTIKINFTDATAVESNVAGTTLGLILGAITQQAEIMGLDDPGNLIVALASDFSDGTFDGKTFGSAITITDTAVTETLAADAGTTGFADAMEEYIVNPNSTLVLSGMADAIASIAADIQTGVEESYVNAGISGTLDGTFGTLGKVKIAIGGDNTRDDLRQPLITSSGKIIIFGRARPTDSTTGNDGYVAQFNSDGTLDTTFGTSGITIQAIAGNQRYRGGTLTADGKIIIAGIHNGGDVSLGNDVSLLRFNSDGTLDTTFGTAGHTTTNTGSILNPEDNLVYGDNEMIYHISLDSSGRILATGESEHYINPDGTAEYRLMVLRYSADGLLDTTFGTNGVFEHKRANAAWPTWGDHAFELADGKIIVSGNDSKVKAANGWLDQDALLIRLNSDGTPDTSFNPGGIDPGYLRIDLGGNEAESRVLVLPDGKFLLTSLANSTWNDCCGDPVTSDLAIARLNSDGSFDTTFGPDGTGKVLIDLAVKDYFGLPCVNADGDIFVSASLWSTNDFITTDWANDSALIKLSSDGILDTSFGDSGVAYGGFAGISTDAPDNSKFCAIDEDGNILQTGRHWTSDTTRHVFIARYLK